MIVHQRPWGTGYDDDSLEGVGREGSIQHADDSRAIEAMLAKRRNPFDDDESQGCDPCQFACN